MEAAWSYRYPPRLASEKVLIVASFHLKKDMGVYRLLPQTISFCKPENGVLKTIERIFEIQATCPCQMSTCMKRLGLEIKTMQTLRWFLFVCSTLWSGAALASYSQGDACRHFEDCPTGYTILFSLLGPYLLWLAWDMLSAYVRNRNYLRAQKAEEADRRQRKKNRSRKQR